MIDLKKITPKAIQNKQFWIDFIDSYSEELQNVKTEVLDKYLLDYYDFRTKEEFLQLLPIAESFGYPIDVSLNDSSSYLQKEIESIAFRKKYKTTYMGYEFSYKNIEKLGAVFILFSNNIKLIRAMSSNMIEELDSLTVFSNPILFLPEENIDLLTIGELYYDQSPAIYYDSNGMYYDLSSFKIPTKHIAIEYFLNSIQTDETSKEYLITNDYFRFLRDKANYNRRAIETPHIGSQLSLVMDKTGIWDAVSPDGQYTIPALKLKSCIEPTLFPFDEYTTITKIKIGSGTQELPGVLTPVPFPTDLVNPLYEEYITPEEAELTEQWIIIQSMIGINYAEELISDVPIVSFSYTVLRTPFRKKSFKIFYTLDGIEYEAKDDGYTNILGFGISSGVINYLTGQIDVTFDSETTVATTVKVGYTYNSYLAENESGFSYTEITEVGLFDDEDNMIAYGTFPPIQYNDNKYHLSFQFLVRRRSFGFERLFDVAIDGQSNVEVLMAVTLSLRTTIEAQSELTVGLSRNLSFLSNIDATSNCELLGLFPAVRGMATTIEGVSTMSVDTFNLITGLPSSLVEGVSTVSAGITVLPGPITGLDFEGGAEMEQFIP